MNELRDHEIAPRLCLTCGAETVGAMGIDGHEDPPTPDDLSICLSCGALNVFTAEGFRRPTEEEALYWTSLPIVKRALRAVLDAGLDDDQEEAK